MTIKRYNKATAAVLSGAAMAVLTAFVDLGDPKMIQAVEVLVTAGFVWLVPNG